MNLEKVTLKEAIRLGFGEPTVVIKLPVQKVPPRVKQRTGLKVENSKRSNHETHGRAATVR